MKKIMFFLILVLVANISFAGDVVVNSPTMNAGQPAKKNQIITLGFKFTAIDYAISPSGFDPTKITISLRKLNPMYGGSLNVTCPSYFTASFIAGTGTGDGTIVLTHNYTAEIPGDQAINISFTAKVTDETSNPLDALTQGQGMNINIVPGSSVVENPSTVNDNTKVFGYTDGVLAVNFGDVTASFVGNDLNVNWSSLKEVNNKEFVIEASKDGKEFVELARVASKATDGNSNETIQYSYKTPWNEVAVKFGFPVAIMVLITSMLLMFVLKNRYKKVLLPIMVLAISVIAYSCNKKDKDTELTKAGDIYVRVGQVEKNASTINYSAAFKAVNQ
ncbi:MAG: hypothetical protein E6Q95_00590 [Chitinophagaceae bacterium]|nr:MAG: hypothetical protein E6Q95_00590 [Chitinophagaceae bacterium]